MVYRRGKRASAQEEGAAGWQGKRCCRVWDVWLRYGGCSPAAGGWVVRSLGLVYPGGGKREKEAAGTEWWCGCERAGG